MSTMLWIPSRINSEIHMEICYNQTVENKRQRGTLKSSKRRVTGQIKEIPKNVSKWNTGQNHNGMKVEINNKSNSRKFTNV